MFSLVFSPVQIGSNNDFLHFKFSKVVKSF